MQNIVMATQQEGTMFHYSLLTALNKSLRTSLDITIDFECFISLEITLMELTHPKG